MGTLILPASGLVYLDANPIIYTVEKHPVYGPLLQPVTTALEAASVLFVSNDLGFRSVPNLPLMILDDLLTP